MSHPVLPRAVATTYEHRYAILDVETTGLKPERDRVLQVAIALMEPDGQVTDRWSTLVDPGCDPGPVHVHGITRDRLRGAPHYEAIAPKIHEMLSQRVVVAHNARFDWSFLEHEANRLDARFTAHKRLCTYQLSQRFDLPVYDFKLATLCNYWGVQQARPHDAEDDVRVLVEVTRHSLALAHRLGVPLPLSTPRPLGGYPAIAPRTPCPWKYAGRHALGSPLKQGMTVVFTGHMLRDRAQLIEAATQCGLDVMNSLSSRTSVLVSNAEESTRKAELARRHGTSVLTEDEFLSLLDSVQPGEARTIAEAVVHAPPSVPSVTRQAPRAPGPFSRRRVIILGGSHDEAASVRSRVQEFGGSCAVNLTVSVTDYVELADAVSDGRWAKAMERQLTRLDPVSLQPVAVSQAVTQTPATPTHAGVQEAVTEAVLLPRGGVTDLDHQDFTVTASWVEADAVGEVDVVAFLTDLTDAVGADEDFCFYNQPRHPDGVIDLDLDTAGQASADIHASRLPENRRVTLAATIDGTGTFGELGAVELTVRSLDGSALVRSTLDAAAEETSLLLAQIYWRNGTLRFRSVGQGYQRRLGALAVGFGVDIEEDD